MGLHAHHIRFWSRQGRTEVSNLVLVCGRHHHLVHEGGWTLTGDPNVPTGLIFTRPDGRVVSTEPARCSERVRNRIVPDPPPAPGPDADPDDEACPARRRAERLEAIRLRIRRAHLRDLADHAP